MCSLSSPTCFFFFAASASPPSLPQGERRKFTFIPPLPLHSPHFISLPPSPSSRHPSTSPHLFSPPLSSLHPSCPLLLGPLHPSPRLSGKVVIAGLFVWQPASLAVLLPTCCHYIVKPINGVPACVCAWSADWQRRSSQPALKPQQVSFVSALSPCPFKQNNRQCLTPYLGI